MRLKGFLHFFLLLYALGNARGVRMSSLRVWIALPQDRGHPKGNCGRRVVWGGSTRGEEILLEVVVVAARRVHFVLLVEEFGD